MKEHHSRQTRQTDRQAQGLAAKRWLTVQHHQECTGELAAACRSQASGVECSVSPACCSVCSLLICRAGHSTDLFDGSTPDLLGRLLADEVAQQGDDLTYQGVRHLSTQEGSWGVIPAANRGGRRGKERRLGMLQARVNIGGSGYIDDILYIYA